MRLIKDAFLNAKGEIYLSQSEIRKLTDKYDIEEIIKVLGTIVDEIPFPYSEYTEQEIKEDFNALKNTHLEIIKGEWTSHRVEDSIPLLYKGDSIRFPRTNNIGGKVSNQFTEKLRLSTPHARYKSWVDLWYAKRKYWLKYFFNQKMWDGEMKQSSLKKGLGGQYNCSQFKPLIANSLYNSFGAKRVLDFSAGWGDRLVGFLASNADSYIGIDPNTKLHEPYKNISKPYKDKETKFICSPAEDVDYTKLKYDFSFASPPYFDLERYSDEDTQSWKRYPNIERWKCGFLFPTLKKVWESLDHNGRMVVNISDVYSKGNIEQICSPMLKHMKSLGATYEGVIGYEMNQRTSVSTSKGKLPFCEPMFVWSKGSNPPKPNWNPNLFFTF